ncbi:MAG: DUF6907 domain-containing protein [Mycobacteriales bacterium]
MTDQTTDRPEIDERTANCPAWCEGRDEHVDVHHYFPGGPVRAIERDHVVDVHAVKYFDTAPVVRLAVVVEGRGFTEAAAELTPAAARAVARLLLETADVIDGVRR